MEKVQLLVFMPNLEMIQISLKELVIKKSLIPNEIGKKIHHQKHGNVTIIARGYLDHVNDNSEAHLFSRHNLESIEQWPKRKSTKDRVTRETTETTFTDSRHPFNCLRWQLGSKGCWAKSLCKMGANVWWILILCLLILLTICLQIFI